MDDRRFLREKDLMRRLGVKSRVTIHRWTKSGYLPPPKALGPTGNINVWDPNEIDAWIENLPPGGKHRPTAAMAELSLNLGDSLQDQAAWG
jgi:predicted DNA-binding transcriptional regulator AlpA